MFENTNIFCVIATKCDQYIAIVDGYWGRWDGMESMDASEQRAGRGWFRAGGFAKWEPPMRVLYISGLKTGKEPALPERTAQHWARTYQAVRGTAVVSSSSSSSSSSNSLLLSSNALATFLLVSFCREFCVTGSAFPHRRSIGPAS
jgi:hypothetical protein